MKICFFTAAILFSVLAVCGLVMGCELNSDYENKNKNNYENGNILTPLLEREIKAAFLNQFVLDGYPDSLPDPTVDDIYITRYYGTFNGCSVVRMDTAFWGYPAVVVQQVIGGTVIGYGSPPFALAYKDRKFYDLDAAYEQGFLTLDNIITVAIIQDYGKSRADFEQEIKEEYLKVVLNENPDFTGTSADIKIEKFYGIFTDFLTVSAVVMLNIPPYIYNDEEVHYTVNGVTVVYPNSNKALVYRDKQFYDLRTAYEEGFLTLGNIMTIAVIQNYSRPQIELEQEIKQSYLTEFVLKSDPQAAVSVDDVSVVKFYGIFNNGYDMNNGCAVVMISSPYIEFDRMEHTDTIDGINIYYPYNTAFAYKNNKFYDLKTAFENGILTSEEIWIISVIQSEPVIYSW
jgi:hypothetical protein